MIVVDTNVVVALCVPTADSEVVASVYRQDPSWALPLLWRSELRSVLAGYLRRGSLELRLALQIAEAAEQRLGAQEFAVRTPRVLELVHRSRCSAYDCEFVALALDLGAPLVTYDTQVLKDFPKIACTPKAFVARTGG